MLWLLQDVFFAAGEVLSDQAFAHNAGFVEDGACPSTISGPVLGTTTADGAPRSFLGEQRRGAGLALVLAARR